MIIKEKKFTSDKLIYKTTCHKDCTGNFIVLDDKTYRIDKNVTTIFKKIGTYDYNVFVVNPDNYKSELLDSINNFDYDVIVTVGTGGKQIFSVIKDKLSNHNIINIIWNRAWHNSDSVGFNTNINSFVFKNKKILLVEDVIASGNTLWTLKEEIERLNGTVVGIVSMLIQESSPLFDKSFVPMISLVYVKKPLDANLDPFWFPPIYSLRHLLFGDEEMEEFYDSFNKYYFNNSKEIEDIIKSLRGGVKSEI